LSAIERIGNAILYLGDARDAAATLPSASIDFIFTDPPYGHRNNDDGDLIQRWEAATGKRVADSDAESRPIIGDDPETANALIEWLFADASRLLRPGCVCCCCCGGGGGPNPQFAHWTLMMDATLEFKQMVVWDKGPMGMGWHYRRSYEVVLVGQKSGAPCAWHDRSDAIKNIIRPGYRGIRKIIPSKEDHPTPKPPELARHFIRLHSRPGETVFDPFMGGGSTGVAALREGRRFIGVEMDHRWFDMACRNIEAVVETPDLFVESRAATTAAQEEMQWT
jgi:DNA modification methylase